jgi:hypothetical protein
MESAKHPSTRDAVSEEQTMRTAPECFDGYSAAPAGQRVVDVKASAVRGVSLKAAPQKICAPTFENAFGLLRQVLTGSMRRVGHRVW